MNPPRAAQLLLRLALTEPDRECLLGDLEEQFRRTAARRGAAAARRRYWRQALLAVWHRRDAARRQAELPGTPRRTWRPDMSNLWRDLRLGGRTAWRSPGYSAVAIVTLALAIGANSMLFSIADPLIVRGFPIKDAGSLAWIWVDNPASGVTRGGASMPEFLSWRAHATTIVDLAARDSRGGTLTGLGDAQHVTLERVTANLTDLWGFHAVVGRIFQPGDDTPGRPAVAVLSYHYWEKAFQRSPGALNRTIFIDDAPVTIVGVMDPSVEVYGLMAVDVWVPLPLDPGVSRDLRTLRPVGRLAPGATLAAANAEIKALAAVDAREHGLDVEGRVPRVVSTRTAVTGPNTWVLLALLAVVVVFVLAIACANLANLVLARIVRRTHEFAVRRAIGASRWQIVRPLVAESLILGCAGGVGGLAVANAGLRLINATAHDSLLQQIGLNGDVLAFAALLAIGTPLIFSLWPAWSAGADTSDTLRAARTSGGVRARRRRNVLVGAEVALALSLLVLSGLVLQTMRYYQQLQVGFDLRHELTFTVEPPSSRYGTDAARASFAASVATRLSSLPGVTGAAVASHLPVFDGDVVRTLTGTAHDGTRVEDRPWASSFVVSPTFFDAVAIPLLAGRPLQASDVAGAQPVAIISRLTAEKYFDGITQALGRTITVGGRGAADRRVTIVGVVGNTRDSNVTSTSPQIYLPFAQAPAPEMTVIVRSDAPADRAGDVRAAMREVDPAVAISAPKTVATLVEEGTGDNRIVNGLFLGFAVLALVLSAAGLYGVISYSVGQRQREIGVRLALGAAPAAIRRMVFGESVRVTLTGTVIGLVLALLLARGAASVLFGVSPTDPLTYGSMTALVLVVGILAAWSPAARAMRIDPVDVLKAD